VNRPSPGPAIVGTSAPITLEPRLENASRMRGRCSTATSWSCRARAS
jgi:hypothetical protein